MNCVLLLFLFFYFNPRQCSESPVLELNEPGTPIFGASKKRKDPESADPPDTNPIGHPRILAPEYLQSKGMFYSEDVRDFSREYLIEHRALLRYIRMKYLAGICFYDDALIPEDALFSYNCEIIANQLMDQIADAMIEESLLGETTKKTTSSNET